MTQTIRILTVDDHPLLRQGIASLLADEPDMSVVAEATTGSEAVEPFRNHRPDVTLMDLQMPEIRRPSLPRRRSRSPSTR